MTNTPISASEQDKPVTPGVTPAPQQNQGDANKQQQNQGDANKSGSEKPGQQQQK